MDMNGDRVMLTVENWKMKCLLAWQHDFCRSKCIAFSGSNCDFYNFLQWSRVHSGHMRSGSTVHQCQCEEKHKNPRSPSLGNQTHLCPRMCHLQRPLWSSPCCRDPGSPIASCMCTGALGKRSQAREQTWLLDCACVLVSRSTTASTRALHGDRNAVILKLVFPKRTSVKESIDVL